MSRAITIARREFFSYLFSPIAYVAMTLFLIVAGVLFSNDFEPGQPAAMRNIFEWMVWLQVAIIPLLCMGLLAQEWASGTIESVNSRAFVKSALNVLIAGCHMIE